MLIESRQDIKSRILRVLSRSWGYQGSENEEAFDPLVQILINAISGELERISGEAYTSHLRLADRLAEILVPGIDIAAIPAHAIAVATPNEPSEQIIPTHQFVYQTAEDRSTANHQKANEIFFSPTDYFSLHKTEIKYLAIKNQLIGIENKRYQDVIAESKNRLPNSQVWIGLLAKDLPNSIENLRFYFELADKTQQEYFNYYLKQSEWFFNDKKITSKAGYGKPISGEQINLENIRNGAYSDAIKQLEVVNSYYKDNFLTLSEIKFVNSDLITPPILEDLFGKTISDTRDILWLRVQFYETIHDNLLKQLSIYVNAFPILNRKLNELTSRMEFILNIIPLQDEDFFWNVEDIADSDGNAFRIKDISEQESLNKKTALIRREGVGRLDQRSAMTQIQNLMNAIKDERASFARLDSDMLNQNLKDLTGVLNRISETVDNVTDIQDTAFLVVKNESEDQIERNVFIKFWTTAGIKANNISPGTQLFSEIGIDLLDKEGLLITTTIGGQNKANREEMLSKMRKKWLTRNRIVTNQDIVNVCHEHFRGRIQDVEIKKGISTDHNRQYGLNRTLDVYITPKAQEKIPENEWDYLMTSFYELLENNSSNAFKYQVFKVDNT